MRACQRFGILPPGAKAAWDDCGRQARLDLMNYDDVATEDEVALKTDLAQLPNMI